jgi:hypothetical protein
MQLNHLLDVKQKNTNILEAAAARHQANKTRFQAEQTAKQGRTILVFTIVTIVFVSCMIATAISNIY